MKSVLEKTKENLFSKRNKFVGRIQWDLDTCTGCGSFLKKESLFCDICEQVLINYKAEESTQKIGFDLKIHALFSWNPGESDMLSSFLMKLKNYKSLKPYRYWASQLALERFLKEKNIDEAVIIPCPSKQFNQPDHAFRLAFCLSELTSFELQNPLRRVTFEAQKNKDKRERQEIYFENHEKFTTKKLIIFVDDIVTTGSTARAAYKTLGEPRNFEIWCLAYRQQLAARSLN